MNGKLYFTAMEARKCKINVMMFREDHLMMCFCGRKTTLGSQHVTNQPSSLLFANLGPHFEWTGEVFIYHLLCILDT